MRKIIVGTFVLILITSCSIVTIGGYKAYRLLQITSSMRSIQTQMEDATSGTDIHTVDIELATRLLNEARTEAVALQDEVEPLLFLAPLLDWTPEFGPMMSDAEHYIELTNAFTTIMAVLAPEIEQGLQIVQGRISDEETLPQILALLAQTEPKFASIEDDIARAQLAYASIENPDALPQQIQAYVPLLDRYMPRADELLNIARMMPDLLGADEPRSYMIVAQNEDSLRATGGAIRDIGILTVDNGDITRINFESTVSRNTLGFNSSESYGESYAPFAYFLNQPELTFRDSNHWPDYAISAEKMSTLYSQSYSGRAPLDGVIAIDQQLMAILVDSLGELNIDAYGTVKAEDVVTLLRRAQDSRDRTAILSDDWWLYHESVLDVLVDEAKVRFESGFDSIDIAHISTSMLAAIEERHLQIWLNEDHEQALLRKLDWANELFGSDHDDTLFIVDSNMGQNLANMTTDRSATYDVALDWNGSADAKLDIQYSHSPLYQVDNTNGIMCEQQTAFATTNATPHELLADQCYYNYLRIFTPPSTQIKQGTRHAMPAEWFLNQTAWNRDPSLFVDDSGLMRIENFLVVPRGETVQSQYSYAIAGPVLRKDDSGLHQYNLSVLKQAGHKPEALTVHVNLPQGARFVKAIPEPTSVDNTRITFQFDQRSKVEVQVDFR